MKKLSFIFFFLFVFLFVFCLACLCIPFAFAFAHLSGLVQAPACERLLRAFIKKGGIALVHTSSTSAPELASVLL